jgi:hypothetical protein
MNFEKPLNANETQPEQQSESEVDNKAENLKNKFKRATTIGAIAAATFGAEGCKPDDEASKNQEFAREALRVLDNLNQEEEARDAEILSSYFNNVENPYRQVFLNHSDKDETITRARDLIKKKGMFKNGVDGKINIECKRIGLVPVEIKVNGQFVPLSPDDYTQAELNFLRTTPKGVESLDDEQTKQTKQNSAPDSKQETNTNNKAFISNADEF